MKLVNLPICGFPFAAMGLNANLEKNFSWLAFPGLIRAIVMLQAVVFVLILIKPETASFFEVTADGLESGEYWRLISWIFFPLVDPFSPLGTVFSAFLFYIVMRIAFLFSDSLEHAWGEVRTSFYLYGCLICQIVILFFIPISGVGSQMLYLAVFFAFATLFPHHEFMMMFVLPVKVWVLALISAIGLLLQAFKFPSLFWFFILFYVISFLPYLIWAIPRLWHWRKYKTQISARRVKFQSQNKAGEIQSLHRCNLCQRTEVSDPDLDFRVTANGEEYCLDHLDDDGNPTGHE